MTKDLNRNSEQIVECVFEKVYVVVVSWMREKIGCDIAMDFLTNEKCSFFQTYQSKNVLVMNRSGAPANCWILCLINVCYLLNHIACPALDGKIPLFALCGITSDITIILLFTFYHPVFYAIHDQHFPSNSEECLHTG